MEKEKRPTPEQSARLDRVLEVLVWTVWAVMCWNLIGFLFASFFA